MCDWSLLHSRAIATIGSTASSERACAIATTGSDGCVAFFAVAVAVAITAAIAGTLTAAIAVAIAASIAVACCSSATVAITIAAARSAADPESGWRLLA